MTTFLFSLPVPLVALLLVWARVPERGAARWTHVGGVAWLVACAGIAARRGRPAGALRAVDPGRVAPRRAGAAAERYVSATGSTQGSTTHSSDANTWYMRSSAVCACMPGRL